MAISNKLENNSIILQVPFEGFYCSVVDAYIDHEIEQESEYREEEGTTPFEDQKIDFTSILKVVWDAYKEGLKLNRYIDTKKV